LGVKGVAKGVMCGIIVAEKRRERVLAFMLTSVSVIQLCDFAVSRLVPGRANYE
jgi:hypothetical protein